MPRPTNHLPLPPQCKRHLVFTSAADHERLAGIGARLKLKPGAVIRLMVSLSLAGVPVTERRLREEADRLRADAPGLQPTP